MPLTVIQIKALKAIDKPKKSSDGGGLYLFVQPDKITRNENDDKDTITAGGKYWRLAYRFDGKQKTLALGVYPAVSLADAREKREEV